MTKLLLATFTLFYVSSTAQMNRLSEQIGNVKKVTPTQAGYNFELTNAFAKIAAYNATTVRVRVSKQNLTDDFSFAIDNLTPTGNFIKKDEEANSIILYTDSLLVEITKQPFRVNFYNRSNKLLNADDKDLSISWFGNQVSCYKKLHSDEKFIGLGEKLEVLIEEGTFLLIGTVMCQVMPQMQTHYIPLFLFLLVFKTMLLMEFSLIIHINLISILEAGLMKKFFILVPMMAK